MIKVNKSNQESELALKTLLSILKQKPEIWEIRKEAVRILFDSARYKEAADLVWSASEIPSVDLEIAFVARTVCRAAPQRSIRLLKYVLTENVDKPIKLLAIANALMHYGMVMQASRFYGAAIACDESLHNGELEHFLLWLDDSQRLWGDWEKDGHQLEVLPWVKRDQGKNADYEKAMSGLTTPIKVAGLNDSTSEHLINEYYRQLPEEGGEITAPPAVTVPLDRLDLDDVLYDKQKGATLTEAKKSLKKPHSFEKPEGVATTEFSPAVKRDPILPKSKRQSAPAAIQIERVDEGRAEKPTLLMPSSSDVEPRRAKLLF